MWWQWSLNLYKSRKETVKYKGEIIYITIQEHIINNIKQTHETKQKTK